MNSGSKYITMVRIAVTVVALATVLPAAKLNDSTQADQYTQRAAGFFSRAQYDSAAYYYQQAGILLKSEKPLEFIAAQIGLANAKLRLGESRAVIGILHAADSIGRLNGYALSAQQGSLLMLLGYCNVSKEDFVSAEEYVQQGVTILRNTLGDDHPNVGAALYTMGLVKKKRGKYKEAIASLQQALKIQQTHAASAPLYIANTIMLLGTVYDDLNEFDRAIEIFHRADSIYQSIGQSGSADAGSCYLQMMSSYYNMGDYVSAVETGKRVIEIYSLLGLHHHANVASALLKMGEVYISTGDVDNAKDYLMRSLAVYTEYHPQKRSAIGKIYIHLGDLYNRTADLKNAVDCAEKGIGIYEQAVGTMYPQIGFMYETVAGIYKQAGLLNKSLEYYTKALNARTLVGGSRSRGDLAMLHASLGHIMLLQGKTDSAAVCLRKAWTIDSASSEMHPLQRSLLLRRFGELSEQMKETRRAIEYYHAAILALLRSSETVDLHTVPSSDGTIYQQELIDLLLAKAQLFEKRGKGRQGIEELRAAFAHYRKAMDLLDEVRRGYLSEASKLNLAKLGTEIYRSGCRNALRLFERTHDRQYREAAFLIADRSKGNILLERLFENEARHFAGVPDSLVQAEHILLSDIARLETQWARQPEASRPEDGSAEPKERTRYYQLKQQHREFIEMLEHRYPEYYALKYAVPALTVQNVQDRLDERTAVLEYMFDDSSIYAFTVTKRSLNVVTLKHRARIQSLAQKFTASLKTYDSREYFRSGFELYSSLLRPLKPSIAHMTEVKIIPDGFLHYIPFETLPMRQNTGSATDFTAVKYLISQYDVSYAYSAAVNQKMNERTDAGTASFVGFAPVFKDTAKNGDFFANRDAVKLSGLSDERSITVDGKTFNELKFSEEEVSGIEQTFTRGNVTAKKFLYESATEENFKLYAPQYEIVHVATHGFINEANPNLSAVVFSQPQSLSGTEDGILYVNETFALSLKAKLVVLSSCESGVGRLVDGEGMIALSRGLFYAGAQNLVFSLWKVSDKQTYFLMTELYKHIAAGSSFASSLRSAKLAMISSQETAFPSKWGGFILVGQ
jgi:CHAT domain-containing protein/lipopolysaccharide biosynthesis regulator YciM